MRMPVFSTSAKNARPRSTRRRLATVAVAVVLAGSVHLLAPDTASAHGPGPGTSAVRQVSGPPAPAATLGAPGAAVGAPAFGPTAGGPTGMPEQAPTGTAVGILTAGLGAVLLVLGLGVRYAGRRLRATR
ncbi:hypothetical protein [Kitasatospora sp. NPDC005748]|uniref:hypothetical protein n=1 Tax=unclassified Kitasatospora TaxID=2633591 RepID=UPI0033C0A903